MVILESDDVLNPETLSRIEALSSGFTEMKYFDKVISLFEIKTISGDDGFMLVDPLIGYIPDSEEEKEALRDRIRNNEFAYGVTVSEDFRYSLILLNVSKGVDDSELMEAVTNLLKKYPGKEKTYINGLPYLRYDTNRKITRDLSILLPLGLLVMILFLLLSFREFRGVWLPVSVVIVSTAVSMALLPLLKWDLSLIGVLIPIMMIAIANNYGVHFVARYQELNARQATWGMHLIVIRSLQHLKKPIILTGLTTIVGILGLITHLMIPARQMGLISALGVGFALVLSLTFIPAFLSTLKKGKIHSEYSEQRTPGFASLLSRLSDRIVRYPRWVIAVFLTLLIIAGSGISLLKTASNNDKVLPARHPYNQSISIANEHFGGTRFLSVLFEGDLQDPELLGRLSYYEQELKKMPETGSVTSLATVVRIMSRAFHENGSEEYNQIPNTHEAIAQYLLLYSMSGDPDDFENLANFDYTKGILNIQFQANDMKTLDRVIEATDQLTREDPARKVLSGFSLTDREMARSITTGQIYSLIFAMVSIFLLLSLIFKSITAGAIGSIPLIFSVVGTFGMMGILRIELNLVTALLSSISIGVGVDYTIHLFWRLKSELQMGASYPKAIHTSLKNTGRGIVINAFSVILGFSVLYFSAFPYLKMFATLIILSLMLCLMAALILIPALCLIIRPSFLLQKDGIVPDLHRTRPGKIVPGRRGTWHLKKKKSIIIDHKILEK